MNLYKRIIRPVFFLFDPEKIHHFVIAALRLLALIPGMNTALKKMFVVKNPALERNLFSIRFPNPIGLAAGFDKDAKLIREMALLGFGFVEVGTVTPRPQPGNPKPRMFRLKKDQALINRMGFNNEGVDAMVQRLRNRPANVIVGGNIGKNKSTPNEAAVEDYEYCFRALFNHVDYFVVNVSSPNTPDLRSLQEKEPLARMLKQLQMVNDELSAKNDKREGEIAPDLSFQQLDEIVEVVLELQLDGIIATNTTISRSNLQTDADVVEAAGAGGLSGKPLTDRSTEVIRYLAAKSGDQFVIIGVGGIHSPQDALDKMNAGADLIQLYTGFIYEGPSLIRNISNEIVKDPQLLPRK